MTHNIHMKKQIIIDELESGFMIKLIYGDHEENHAASSRKVLSIIYNKLLNKEMPEQSEKPVKNKML